MSRLVIAATNLDRQESAVRTIDGVYVAKVENGPESMTTVLTLKSLNRDGMPVASPPTHRGLDRRRRYELVTARSREFEASS